MFQDGGYSTMTHANSGTPCSDKCPHILMLHYVLRCLQVMECNRVLAGLAQVYEHGVQGYVWTLGGKR